MREQIKTEIQVALLNCRFARRKMRTLGENRAFYRGVRLGINMHLLSLRRIKQELKYATD